MPRKNSLTHAEITQNVRARRIQGETFSLSVWKLPHGRAKFACVVSKKVAPKAHDRNLIKRCCREAARAYVLALDVPLAIVAHARKQAAEASYDAIRKDVQRLIQSSQ